ncbi:MAG: AAA family ATPase [Pseudomonadota bacterium]
MKRSVCQNESLTLPTASSLSSPIVSTPLSSTPSATDLPPQSTPFPYRDYVAARGTLLAAIDGKPFYATITGISGTGKTSLQRELSNSFDRQEVQFTYVSSPSASVLGISRFCVQMIHLAPKRFPLETSRVLANALKSQQTHQVLWIDEADRLPKETITDIRTLAECDPEVPQLFSVVFSGLPEFDSLMNSPPLFPMKRRISVRLSLSGLCRDELDAFIIHRFGSHDEKRVPGALRDEIFERTLATPALVDRVVRHALCLAGSSAVREEHLRESFNVAGI